MHVSFTYKKVMMQFCTVFVNCRLKSCNLWLKVLFLITFLFIRWIIGIYSAHFI